MIGCPVYLLNDVRMATLGELKYGHGTSASTMAFFALGTGVGGGGGGSRFHCHPRSPEISHKQLFFSELAMAAQSAHSAAPASPRFPEWAGCDNELHRAVFDADHKVRPDSR